MIYAFHDCVLDTSIYTLTRAGEVRRLSPKVFQVLHYLLECRERVVTKRDLLEAVWPGQHITETTLESTISAVRRSIGDSGRNQRVIATLSGHGYRFIAPVAEMPETSRPAHPAPDLSGPEAPPVEIAAPEPPGLDPELVLPVPENDASTPAIVAASTGAERRQLTVLFCDLIESTSLISQLDLEDYRELVRDYQAVCANAIERFEGYIAQYLGDGLLIYFGYPAAHEDDAQRAVWSGLDIVAAIEKTLNPRLQRVHGVGIAARLGIHTGQVIVGNMGGGSRQEQLAIGETPAIAARLQNLAAPNTVVISDATARLVQGYFTLEALGPHRLKGIAEPMSLSRVLGRTDAQRRFDVVATRGITPLVGREYESGLLQQRWEQACEGQGQVVVVSGESGIGKSRLVLNIKEQLKAQSHYRIELQTSPHFQYTPLYPVVNFVRRLLRVTPEDTPADKLAKLEETLVRFRLPFEESVPLVSDLLAFPMPAGYRPLALSPQVQRRRTLLTLIAICQELAERHPLLFIMEDLHWGDPSTLELLDLLIEQIPTTSILTILTCRLEFQRLWGALSYLTHVTLARLPRVQMVQIAMSIVKENSLSKEMLEYIVGKTDGVPLFVEEMTKAIVESGCLTSRDVHHTSSETRPKVVIPETLQDSLMARLDRLDSAKVVAQYASVIGRQFPYALLEVLLPLDAESLQNELSRLVAAELIHQRGQLPHATFIFKHALVQETAYQSLLRGTRRRLHQQIADLLEGQVDEPVLLEPELLAHHYTAAGLAEKALSYWRMAGRMALARSAHVEAVSHFTQGLKLLGTLPETPERVAEELSLQTSLGASLIAGKGYAAPEVKQVYLRARDLCRQLDSPSRLLQVLFGLQAMYLTRGALQTARQLAEECLVLAERQSEPPRLPHAHFALGSTLFFLGDFVLAREHLEQGTAIYDPQVHRSRSLNDAGVSCLLLTAWTLWPLGYPDQAVARIQEALDLAEELDSPFSMAYALACAPVTHQGRGEPRVAQERAGAGRKLSQEQEFPYWLALSTTLEGWAMAEQGQRHEGCELMRQGLQAWRDTGAKQTVPYQMALLADAYGKSGLANEGLHTVAEGLAMAEQNEEHCYLAELYRIQGELYLALPASDDAAAQANFDRALRIARTQQAKSLELRAAISTSRLWQRQGKPQQAYALLSDIYGWFSEGFETDDLQVAKRLLDALAVAGEAC